VFYSLLGGDSSAAKALASALTCAESQGPPAYGSAVACATQDQFTRDLFHYNNENSDARIALVMEIIVVIDIVAVPCPLRSDRI